MLSILSSVFQTQHALQEEQEMKNFNASRNGAPTQGVPDKNAMPGNSRVKTEKKHQHKAIQINGEEVK